MARARNIKPGFFTNDVLAEIDPLGRILFAGLWTVADREGRLEDRPKKIKAQVLPYDDCNCDGLLQDLHKHGFIQRYVMDGNAFIQIVKWGEHQNPHVKESESTIPAPDKHSTSPVQVPAFTGTSPADSLSPITDSLNLIPDTGSMKPENNLVEQKTLDRATAPVETIFEFWKKVMASPKSALDKKRRVLIEVALQSYQPADICKAIRGCSKSPHNMGKNDRNTKYNGLNLILRDAEHIDYFMNLDGGNARPGAETVDQMNARITAEFLGDAQADDENTIEMEA